MRMSKLSKKILSWTLVVCMLLALVPALTLPVSVLAEDGEGVINDLIEPGEDENDSDPGFDDSDEDTPASGFSGINPMSDVIPFSTGNIIYVNSATAHNPITAAGNDAPGNGTFAAPYATIAYAYAAATTLTGDTIAVLSDINIPGMFIANADKDLLITSYIDENTPAANATQAWTVKYTGGNLGENSGVFYIQSGTLTFANIILDGDNIFNARLIDVQPPSGKAVLNSGGIIQNGHSTYGGAVRISEPGSEFEMNDGSILRNNHATEAGGAIHFSSSNGGGIGTINGGTITGNTARVNGGAIDALVNKIRIGRVAGGTIDISGNRGNGATQADPTSGSVNNVYLANTQTIEVLGKPHADSKIGVYVADPPASVGTTRNITRNDALSYGDEPFWQAIFSSDRPTNAGIRMNPDDVTNPAEVALCYDSRDAMNVYVSATGTDDTAATRGSFGNPYATIQFAYSQLPAVASSTGREEIRVLSDLTLAAATVLNLAGRTATIKSYSSATEGVALDAADAWKVTRDGVYNGNLMEVRNGHIRLSNIIFDGGNRQVTTSGIVTGTASTWTNPGITVTGATAQLTMNAGSVFQNSWGATGGVSYNTAGLLIHGGGTFNLSGGKITDNTSFDGGGVMVVHGTFNMTSGEVTRNVATGFGAGVYVFGAAVGSKAVANISGGTINNNFVSSTTSGGGGIMIHHNSDVSLSGTAQIVNNAIRNTAAGSAGGIWQHNMTDSTITVKDAVVIRGNTAGATRNTSTGVITHGSVSSNFVLLTSDAVTIADRLTSGAFIGVFAPDMPTATSKIRTVAIGAVLSDAQYFHSDRESDAGIRFTPTVIGNGSTVRGNAPANSVVLDWDLRATGKGIVDPATGDGYITVHPTDPAYIYLVVGPQPGGNVIAPGAKQGTGDDLVFGPVVPGEDYEILIFPRYPNPPWFPGADPATGDPDPRPGHPPDVVLTVDVPEVDPVVNTYVEGPDENDKFWVVIDPASDLVDYAIIDPTTGLLITNTDWEDGGDGIVRFGPFDPGVTYEIITRPKGDDTITGRGPFGPGSRPRPGTEVKIPADDTFKEIGINDVTTADGLLIRVDNTETTQEYAVIDINTGEIVTKLSPSGTLDKWVTGVGGAPGRLTFGPFDPEGAYRVITRDKAGPSIPGPGVTVLPGLQPTSPAPLVPVITGDLKDDGSGDEKFYITADPTSEDYWYAIVDPVTGKIISPAGDWTAGTGSDIEFGPFDPDTGSKYTIVTFPRYPTDPADPSYPPAPPTVREPLTGGSLIVVPPHVEVTREKDGANDKVTFPTESGFKYEIFDEDGILVATITGNGSDQTRSGLDPDKTYTVRVSSSDPNAVGTSNEVDVPPLPDATGTIGPDGNSYLVVDSSDPDFVYVVVGPKPGGTVVGPGPQNGKDDNGELVFGPVLPGEEYEVLVFPRLPAPWPPTTPPVTGGPDPGTTYPPTLIVTVDVPEVDPIINTYVEGPDENGKFWVVIDPSSGLVDYAIIDPATGRLIDNTDWTGGGGRIVFGPLDPGEDYEIITRPKGDATITGRGPFGPGVRPRPGTEVTIPADVTFEDIGTDDVTTADGLMINIDNTKTTQEYAVIDIATGEIVTILSPSGTLDEWVTGTGGDPGTLTFGPFDPEGAYRVVTRDKAGPSIPGPGVVILPPTPADKPAPGGSTLDSSHDSITINPTSTDFWYAIVDPVTNKIVSPAGDWKSGNGGSLTFSPLQPDKEYLVVAVPKTGPNPPNITVPVTGGESITTKPAPGGGGGGGGGGGTPAPTGPRVLVDGEEVDIGTVEDDGDTRIITLDQDELTKEIEKAENNVHVILPADDSMSSFDAVFVVQNVDDMAEKEMDLIITVGPVSYVIPTVAIDTEAIMDALGTDDPSIVPFTVTITKSVDDETMEVVMQALEDGDLEMILPPMQFTITAEYGGKTVAVTLFSEFVSRVIEITAEQAKKITTAIIVEPDGSMRQVPTNIYFQNGKWYAEINSLTNSTYVLVYNDVYFTDAEGTWYENNVNEMGSRKIVTGVGDDLFDGKRDITRAEFAAIIIRALGLPDNGNGAVFSDVPASAWYFGAVGKAHEYNLITGVGGGLFEPDRPITRQEAMIIIQRAAKIAGLAGRTGNLSAFTDAGKVSNWALNAVQWNVGTGVASGRGGGILAPQENIARSESATIVLNFLRTAGLVDVRNYNQPEA